jgi:predicted RNA-binding protein with RPS1 domain
VLCILSLSVASRVRGYIHVPIPGTLRCDVDCHSSWTRKAQATRRATFSPQTSLHSTTTDNTADTKERLKEKGWAFDDNACVYKRIDGQWKRRKELSELKLGQRLWGHKLQTCDLLDGKTGPKVFFDCGVGDVDASGKWQILHGMMRLGPRGMRKTVVTKRLRKFIPPPPSKDDDRKAKPPLPPLVPLYVSSIDLATKRFQVAASLEDAETQAKKQQSAKKIPFGSLKPGQEIEGEIIRVKPYGAIIDIGAQIPGILHITRVRELMGKHIEQEKGMQEVAGIVLKAKVRVSILECGKRPRKPQRSTTEGKDDEVDDDDENTVNIDTTAAATKPAMQKFIELDFTEETKESMAEVRKEEKDRKEAKELARLARKKGPTKTKSPPSPEPEVAASAIDAAASSHEEEEASDTDESLDDEEASDTDELLDDDDDYYASYADDYSDEDYDVDEDRDIEDSLGLGSY